MMHVTCPARRPYTTAKAGLTLIEILMTIFVLAVGLLGVASLMPVGSYQLQRGQIAQRVSEIGPEALDLIEATEINNPKRWLFMDGTTFDAIDPDDPTNPDDREDAVRIACKITTAPTATSFPTSATGLPDRSGGGFVIDFARVQDHTLYGEQWRAEDNNGTVAFLGTGTAPVPQLDDVYVVRRCEPFAIDPLYLSRFGAANFVSAAYGTANMPRLTIDMVLSQDENGNYLSLPNAQAESAAQAFFQPSDDLVVDDTDDDDLPDNRQAWVDSTNGAIMQPLSEGNYSWLATFAPGETTTGSDPHEWTVSVAVFYKRPINLGASGQWTVPLSVATAGANGYTTATLDGSADTNLLYENNDNVAGYSRETGDQMRIKRRQWGLVTFLDGDERRARWYRLGAVGRPDGSNQLKVRLIGPDLPTGAAKITFFEGLEGVFTRTMSVTELPAGST